MNICIECERTFDTPHEYYDDHGLAGGYYEHFSECPYCGGGYMEANECQKCGEYKRIGEHLCTNCKTKLVDKFRKFRDYLIAEEEELLDELLDGRSVTEL